MLPYGNIFADVQRDNPALGDALALAVFRCGVFNTSCASSRFFAFEKRKWRGPVAGSACRPGPLKTCRVTWSVTPRS
jgi:hypothetical protein